MAKRGGGHGGRPRYTYDLSKAPASFDFLVWLAGCATDAGGAFDVNIRAESFRDDNLEPSDPVVRQQFLDNVMLPATRLYPVHTLEVNGKPGGKHRGYLFNDLYQDKPVTSLRVPEWAHRIANQVSDDTVVFNIRHTHYHRGRNSELEQWREAKDRIEAMGHPVLWLDDAQSGGAWGNLILRAALFERAHAVLGVSNGTMALAYLNERVRSVVIKPVADDTAATTHWWERLGIPPGMSHPWCGDAQRIVWEDDTADAIVKAFEELPTTREAFKTPRPMFPLTFKEGVNTTPETMLRQAAINAKRGLPWLEEGQPHGREMLVVGGGPSLERTHTGLYVTKGDIFALNGTHDYLLEREIVPHYHVLLDARAVNVKFVQNPHKDVHYLVAAICHPRMFKALKRHRVSMWAPLMPGMGEATGCPFTIGGGATVALKTMFMGYILGYRTFHFFGLDSSYAGDAHHAYEQKWNDGETVTIRTGDREFRCSPWMAKQAREFTEQVDKLQKLGCEFYLYGDGLLPHAMRTINQMQREEVTYAASHAG
jgi:hypothetical protein